MKAIAPVPILYVEANELSARETILSLRNAGGEHWHVDWVPAPEAALSVEAENYGAVLIDNACCRAGISGLELCRRLRSLSSSIGILVLSADHNLDEKVAAFAAGADDFVLKNPLEISELFYRIQSVLRRSQRPSVIHTWSVLRCGPIGVDLTTQEVTVSGQRIDLTKQQLRLLSRLLRERGMTVSDDELRRASSSGHDPTGATLRKQVERLRARLGSAGNLITVERGSGYRIEDSNVDA